MLKTISLSIIITLCFTACTHKPLKAPTKTNFTTLDHNRDGKISLDEYIAYAEKREQNNKDISLNSNFEVCDKNKDEKITIDELHLVDQVVPRIYGEVDASNPKYFCFINQKQFAFFDKNSDNMITREELKNKRFSNSFGSKCDLNNDKKLDRKEATATSCGYPNDEFTKSDLNHDGFITMQELRYINKRNLFQAYDKNSDGNLDRNEFRNVSFFGDALK